MRKAKKKTTKARYLNYYERIQADKRWHLKRGTKHYNEIKIKKAVNK